MNKPIVSAIVAMDQKRGIGKNNSIPWKIPGEQKMFKEITTPHPMIMGRKTFESLGRLLPNRAHIVLTRDTERIKEIPYDPDAVVVSLEDAIDVAGKSPGSEEIFIIGGGQVFKEALEKGLIDRLYLTIIEGDHDADIFFPEYSGFTRVIREENKEVEGYRYKFLILER